jgi:hypothetical protein
MDRDALRSLEDQHVSLGVEDDSPGLLYLLAGPHKLGQFPGGINGKLESVVPSIAIGWKGERLCLRAYFDIVIRYLS